ncbi:MAG TPA: ATP-binding protein [Polyangiaceae bacterium]
MPGDRVQTARAVRAALGAFFEHACVPVIVVDGEGRFVSANDAAVAQYGWSLDELLGMRIHDFMAAPRPELAKDLQTAMCGDPATLQRRAHRRKDGSVVWVVPRAGPVDVMGERYIVSALQDVTELVAAERRAHVEHEQVELVWQGAVEHFDQSFALLDGDRRVVRVNRTLAKWLRLDEGQILGRRCDELFLKRCTRQPCPHAMAISESRTTVDEFVSSRGRPIRLEVWPAPANDLGVACIHVAHDLTEEWSRRSRLAATERLASLGRVTAGVAHEVNNPAAFVSLALPMARERVAQGRLAEATTLLDEATSAMTQINEVMRDLGGVVRERPRAAVDLALVADGALRIGAIEARARAHVVRSFEDGVVAIVRAPRLAQVILNLVLNAAQAIPEGDRERHTIEVRVRHADDHAVVEVADTGPGVPEDIGERIFEPFFTTRGATGGSGLGLWLSRTIVEEEGGTLTWRNRAARDGGGAVFTVSLPLQPARAIAANAE